MGATCNVCHKDMMRAKSCIKTVFVVEQEGQPDQIVQRIPVGQGADWTEGRCHDCNAIVGGFHHPGCDTERCPFCGGQILSCNCLVNPNIKEVAI